MVSILITLVISMAVTITVKALAVRFVFLSGWVIPCYIVTFVLLAFFICYIVADCYKRFKG